MIVVCEACGNRTDQPVASQLYEGSTICPACAKADEHDAHELDKFAHYLNDPEPHGQAKYEAHYGCACEPAGSDGLRCPRPDGTLLCEDPK